ncbi:MAG: rod shape-determining protein MreC [Candidatus Zipacnadales bacterium]
MRRRFINQPGDWRVLVALLVVAAWLMVSHYRARITGRTPLQERAAQFVLLPLQQTVSLGWRELTVTLGAIGRSRRLAQENQELRRKNAELETKIFQQRAELYAYQSMVEAFGFGHEKEPKRILAYVVGRSPGSFVRQTIDIVTDGGRQIHKDDIVLWNGRLVGRVEHADGKRARVLLLLDPQSGVAATVKPSNAYGSVLGPEPASRDRNLLRLVRLQSGAAIAVGDKVYTSRLGETYPPGIPIGVVEEVVGGSGPAEPKSALVKPYTNFDNLSYVTVVRWP